MAQIDRSRVRRAFSCGAEAYDDLAVVQQRVIARFLESCLPSGIEPSSLLDVGAGTGRLLEKLSWRFPGAFAVGVDMAEGMARSAAARFAGGENAVLLCADGESLPFRGGSFDLVVSTSTYQWLSPLDAAFGEALRILRPGGLFCFAMFGEATLFELKDSYRSALRLHGCEDTDKSHAFASSADVASALGRAGFSAVTVASELEVELHGDVPAMLRALKGIGAQNASAGPGRGLGGRRVTASMIDLYGEKYGGADGVPATYEVIYAAGTRRQ